MEQFLEIDFAAVFNDLYVNLISFTKIKPQFYSNEKDPWENIR